MAYNPGALKLIAGDAWDLDQVRIWSYRSADTVATVSAANYFADARLKGVQPGDLVVVVVTSSGVPVAQQIITVGATSASGATMTGGTQELTASGAVLPGTSVVELNHASVVIAATLVVVPNSTLIVKDTSATGTAAHTLTLTGGTFNGTNTIATLNARDEFLMVHFDSAGRGQVIANVGSVALSGP
jgi:hypothetical protein